LVSASAAGASPSMTVLMSPSQRSMHTSEINDRSAGGFPPADRHGVRHSAGFRSFGRDAMGAAAASGSWPRSWPTSRPVSPTTTTPRRVRALDAGVVPARVQPRPRPSTPGVSREFLVHLARRTPLLPGAGAVTFIDADSFRLQHAFDVANLRECIGVLGDASCHTRLALFIEYDAGWRIVTALLVIAAAGTLGVFLGAPMVGTEFERGRGNGYGPSRSAEPAGWRSTTWSWVRWWPHWAPCWASPSPGGLGP
jgi:hypothetical protein